MTTDEFLERFEAVRPTGERQWCFRCPAHDDRIPSGSITEKDNGDRLVHCHAGCDVGDVLTAAGLELRDLYAEGSSPNGNGHREIAATYDYTDEAGGLLFQVVRFQPKDFRQRRPDGMGGWHWNLQGTRRVLYRLPALLDAVKRGQDVLVVEGEKDCDRLHQLGVVATCNPQGAGKWRSEYSNALKGANVMVVADADEPGRAHARQVAEALQDLAASVELVEPAAGKDVSDHLAGGKTIGDLVPMDAGHPSIVGSIDTAELLDEIKGFIGRFVVLPSDAAGDLLALWTLHTHAIDAAWATPYLRITSAAPDSGKTLLLEILATICRRGWHAVNPSPAVLYRKVDRDTPTLLLDEMDNFPLDDRRDALAILNTGYKRGATVDRCKDNGELQSFAAYCPKGYAGLDVRSMVPALLSRSITVRMEKKISSEKVDMWIAPLVEPDAIQLRERCEAWAAQHIEALTDHQPNLLGLINRAAEVWWALLSIAEHAGGGWESRAKGAVTVLTTGGDDTDTASDPVQLLLDIRDAFDGQETLFTKDLLETLNALDESPWGARRKGDGLDARGLARMLRPFKVKSRTVRVASETAKGYHVEQFEDAFARHLPEGSQASQASHTAPLLEPFVTDVTDVTDKSGVVGCSCLHPNPMLDGRCERCFGEVPATMRGGAS